ncbi:MAG: carbohydrate kinase family protein [Anaerolineae bacterium]|nr:carbohydrate kinase family protein [Thermoflexales bacterium]MDW8406261.1 carbohydrate kinase family protein [Anaerolineae bacterium]
MADEVLVIGAANLDIKGRLFASLVTGSSNSCAIKTSFGGVARNIAENLARLGTPVVLLTAVGNDFAGHTILDGAGNVGIDVSRALIIENEPTGTYLAALDQDGDLILGLDDLRVMRHLTPDYLRFHQDAFRHCQMVALDMNLTPEAVRAAIHLAREYGKPICVDPTSAQRALTLRPYLHLIDLITPNIAEAEALLGSEPIGDSDEALQAARRLVGLGVERVVITQAERGACYATVDESGQFAALKCAIVDRTGAGDALSALVIFGMREGFGMAESLQLGLRAAALTLQSPETVAPELSLDRLYGME